MSSEADVIEIARDGAAAGGEPVIHWPDPLDSAAWANAAKIRGGNPLLFPFLGRHFVDGEINKWRDAEDVVHDLPTHGFARNLPLSSTRDADGHGLRMTFVDNDATRGGYPFAFRFEAAYRLVDANMLEVELTTSNPGEVALPYYAGHHFYFHLPHGQRAESSIELPRTEERHQLPDGAISEPTPGKPRYSLGDKDIVDVFHCFTGPSDAPVRVNLLGLKRSIGFELHRPDSVPWYCITTWTETDNSDFYCVEPWIGLPDAIHNGHGLRWLAPGKTETASLRLIVTPIA